MKIRVLFCLCAMLPSLCVSGAQFKFGQQTLSVPDGFEIELVAAAPLVDRPISAAFDEQGRLYVTDSAGMAGSPQKQLETLPHRIVRLEDSTGSGRFDKSIVFAGRMMFPEGCMWHNGSLYVCAPPQIWKLTDTDGDGIADKREVWFDGKTLTGCANDLHGPYMGPDGWIYWCKGAFAQQKYERPGKAPFVTRAAHIFRARPDGSQIEPVLTGGMDNPVGVAFNSSGERFLSCTFFQQPGGGRRDGLIHAIYGGVYGKIHDVIYDHKMTGEVMPMMTHMGAAAACGLICSDATGDDFHHNLFACYFNLHKVMRHVLQINGATYTTRDSDFVSSDSPDFHPTDVIEDADGSLLIVDTGGWYKVCCPTSQLAKPDVLGAIYRVRRTGAKALDDPRGLQINWPACKSKELAALLVDKRPFVRQRAIDELAKIGSESIGDISHILFSSKHPLPQLPALCALARIDSEPAREAVRKALSRSIEVRAAIHFAGLWRDRQSVDALLRIAGGTEPWLVRPAAEALGRIGDTRAVPVLLAASGKPPTGATGNEDGARVLEHSIIYALIEIADARGTAAGLAAESSRTKRAALVALDQMDNGGLTVEQVTPFLADKNPELRQTAAWVVGHHPDWGTALAEYFRGRLANLPANENEYMELPRQLAPLAKSPAIQDLLASSVRDSSSARMLALRAMADANLKQSPPAWLHELAQILSKCEGPVLAQAIATARALPQPKGGDAEISEALFAVGRRDALSSEIRIGALAAAGRLSPVEPAMFDFLLNAMMPANPLTERSAAAGVLAKAQLSPEQQLGLVERLKSAGALELQQLLPAFERGANEELGMKLIAALKDAPGNRALRPDVLKPLFSKYPKAVQDAADALMQQLGPDSAQQAEQLKKMLAALPAGDARRGQAIFLSARAACSTCHAIGYLGGHLGPDLTNIGKARNERDLLESIVYPSASFVRSYEPFMVVTKGGEHFNGIIRKDAPDEIVLATGPQTEQRIARSDIKQIQPGTVSLMPEGLDKILSAQELADLIVFLKTAK